MQRLGTILLTGATGFVGSRVLARLVSLGASVIAAGRQPPADRSISFLPIDFNRAETFDAHRDALQRVTTVVHAGGGVIRSSDPSEDQLLSWSGANIDGSARLALALSNLQFFCHLSAVDVYGPPMRARIQEDHPLNPATYYGATKAAAELILGVYSRKSGVPLTVLRLAQVFGPADNSRKVIPNLVRAAVAGNRITVAGDGSDERSYVFVEDVVDAVVLALQARVPGTFNVAGATPKSIREVATTIARLAGCAPPEFRPRPGPASKIVIDISKARAELGYQPRVDLEEGLRRTIEWFRAQ